MATFTIDLVTGQPYLFSGNFNGSGTTCATNLQQVTAVGATTTIESTFSGGLKTSQIRPSADSVTAIQVHKADGITNIINIDTVSGFTGFGTIAPKAQIHLYGTDTSIGDEYALTSNGIRLDGIADTSKQIIWQENCVPKWDATTYRGENSKFWYLSNVESQNNPLTIAESGVIGVNKQTNFLDYHTTKISGSTSGPIEIYAGGVYIQNYITIYDILLASNGSPDMFKWRKSVDDGITYSLWSLSSGCTTGATILEYGVSVQFVNATGNTVNNIWEFAAFPQNPQATFTLAPMGFTEVLATLDYTVPFVEYVDITVLMNGGIVDGSFSFEAASGITTQAIVWGTTVQIDSVYFNLLIDGIGCAIALDYFDGEDWLPLDSRNFLVDGTDDLSKSGRIIWSPITMIGWDKVLIPEKEEPLYWMRIKTSTSPETAPVAKSMSIGNNKRFNIYSSFNSINPDFYVDSLGRVNIGGGIITGSNRFQVNPAKGLSVAAVAGTDSYVEFDSNCSCIATLKLKIADNNAYGTSLEFARTRGTLNVPLSMQTNDFVGRIDFKGRVGNSGTVSSQIASLYVGDGSTTRCADLIFSTACGSNTAVATEKVRIRYDGNTGFGISAPTATIELKAGTTIVAPLKFNIGTLLSIPQVGAVEFDGYDFHFTVTGSTIRKTFAALESPIFTGNVSMPSGTTFAGGLKTCLIIPNSDTTTAIQITKANGTTPLINFDTISGFTGFGTIAPKALIHTYGDDNSTSDNGWNLQSNSIRIDGGFDSDKDVQWYSEGQSKFTAQIYRCENGKFWYLSSPRGHLNQLTVSNTGRIGVNNQTNIMKYHAALMVGGPNDIRVSGVYTQSYTSVIIVEIDSVTGATDTFRWKRSTNAGYTYGAWSSSSGLTLTPVELNWGVYIQFENVTGHTSGTTFQFGAFAQLPVGTFVVSPNEFSEVLTTNDYIDSAVITYTDVTAEANSSTYGTNIIIFSAGTVNNAMYFGTYDEFDSIYINLDTKGSGVSLFTEYWNGLSWVTLSLNNHAYNDGTLNLTQSGDISWEISLMTGWKAAYLKDISEDGYELYWIRLITSTAPSNTVIVNSFARGGNYRMAVLTSPSDFKTSFYVDTMGRTNIGGGNITGNNALQLNKNQNIPVSVGDANSLVELDAESASEIDIKLKLASNDACSGGFIIGKTRGTLSAGCNVQYNDEIGHIKFKSRVGNVGIDLNTITSEYKGNGTTCCGDLIFSTSDGSILNEKLRISGKGSGFGITVPTAQIHIASGTTTIAPLKFTSGSLLNSPQVGAVEFLTDTYYGTITNGTARRTFAFLESPTFSGNPELPVGSTLNNINLCNYIWNSGGTNNSCLLTTNQFCNYTGSTLREWTVTGGTNGISKYDCNNVRLGGALTEHTIISGSSYDFTLSSKVLNLCGVNGVNITDIGGTGVDIYTKSSHIDIRGNNISNVEKTKLLISDTQATFTDSRATTVGIQYNANYCAGFGNRSLVDKEYVDNVASGISAKEAVRAATTGNITLSGLSTVDGISLTNGMRVLVKNQTTGSTNGIYLASASTWNRTSDFNGVPPLGDIEPGSYVAVTSGNTNKNTSWILNTPLPITAGTTTLTFVLFSSSQGTIEGNGICVTSTGGNYNVSVKTPANCGLCIDSTGVYVNSAIAGTGLDYSTGIINLEGSGLAGNSISWSDDTFNVNPASGTLSTALNLKLDKSIYQTYTGTTAPARFLDKSIYQTYTGTTAPARYLDKTIYQTYTGTTIPNTYYNISQIDSYSGKTNSAINLKANISGQTFTGIPSAPTAAVSTCTTQIATTQFVLNQAGTAIPLMDNVTCLVGNSFLYSRQDHVHPSDTTRLLTSTYQNYTGTTAPNQFASKSFISTYTGTTVPNTYLSKATFTTYSGTTVPNTYYDKTQIDSYSAATKIVIDCKANIASPTFTGTVRSVTPATNDNSTCIATTAWYIGQCATAVPNMDSSVGAIGSSALWAHGDHTHPSDTSRVIKNGDTMTGTLKGTIFSGSTCVASPVTIGTICICSPIGLFSTSSCSPLHCGACGYFSTVVCSPIITGSTRICSPIVCATSCSASPLHCGACTYATTRVCSPIITGSTKVCSPTIIATTCLCSVNTTKLVGATTGSTLFLTTTPPSGNIQTPTLFWNSISKQIEAHTLTGGSDQYFYSEDTTNRRTTSTTCIKAHGYSATTLAGKYQVDFNLQLGNATANDCSFAALKVDNTAWGSNYLQKINTNNGNQSISMSRDITLIATLHCFDIWFWNTGGTACVPISSIRVKRIC